MQEQITTSLDDTNTNGVIVMSFDMSRAFDRIPHDKLIKHLSDAGLPRQFLNWWVSYL